MSAALFGGTRFQRHLAYSITAISVYLALPVQAQSPDAVRNATIIPEPLQEYISPISMMPLNSVPYAITIPGFPPRGQYISPMSLLPLPDYSYTAGYPVSPLWRDRGLTVDPFSLLPWIPPVTIVPAVVSAETDERIIPLSAARSVAAPDTGHAVEAALNATPLQIASVGSFSGPVVVDFPPGTTLRRR